MFPVERELVEKELGRVAFALLEGIYGTNFLEPIIGNQATYTLQRIQDILNNENLTDFECVEEIVVLLGRAGISTSRHDFG